MTLASWPGTLPQSPLMDGLEFQRANNKVSFSTEVGEPKERRRFTGRRKTVPLQLPALSTTQKDEFITFYETTLNDGADFFTWDDFETGEMGVAYKFVDPAPTVRSINGSQWRVSMTIRRIY